MAEKTFSVNFDGYWREPNISGIPIESGIYCVYECTFSKESKTVNICRLIYIGESENVNDRVAKHEKWPDWKKEIGSGKEICISFSKVGSSDRNRVEAAMIFKHKPPVNSDYISKFPFDKTTINTSGENSKLSTSFTVNKTE